MAYSYSEIIASGGNTFNIPFDYIEQSEISVFVDGVSTSFTFTSSNVIDITPAPTQGAVVRIARDTNLTSRAVDFASGAVLTEEDLDNSNIQVFHAAQEAIDKANAAISLDVDGKWEAESNGTARVIKNVADPVNANDAVNKSWAETGMSSQLAQATTQATTATTAATTATTQATAAAASASTASTAASTATTKASEASTSATSAAASATTATTQATTATTQAGIATTKASEAATSATAASGSASTASTQAGVATSAASTATSQASTATTQAGIATTQAATATTKAGEASTSATSAATSASQAQGYRDTTLGYRDSASASATSALSSANTATTKANDASGYATAASSSATAASAAQTAAESARDSALAAYDSFDDRYLGAKASDPTLDNDGQALIAGALYFNTTVESMKLYTGSAWVSAYASGSDFVAKTGSTMSGNLSFGDNNKAIFGAGSDLQIYHDGSNSYIEDVGTGNLYLKGSDYVVLGDASGGAYFVGGLNSSAYMYYDNSLKLSTTSTGIDVTGTVTADGIALGDSHTATFGDSNDLQIVHNGSYSAIVDQGTGSLWLGGDGDVSIANAALNEYKANFSSNGGCSFYYDNVQKLATTSTGAAVTGTITASRGVGATQTTSVGSAPAPDMDVYQNFVWTLTANTTLGNPTTEAVGQSGFFVFKQDATGGRTVSLSSEYKTAGGAGLTLSSAANAIDIVPYIVSASGQILLGTPQLAFA